jgi:hypothetical protein
MKVRISVIALLAASIVFSQHNGNGQLDKSRYLKIISNLKRKHTRWEQTSEEFIAVKPFWKDIAIIRVQWGLNKDPAPDPYVYYATADNKIHMELTAALRSMKYVPRDGGEAIDIAGMMVQSANPNALVIKKKDDIKSIPKKVARTHNVSAATAKSSDSTMYDIVIFSYQAPEQGSFTRHGRAEELKKHTISLHNGKVRFDSRDLPGPIKKQPD